MKFGSIFSDILCNRKIFFFFSKIVTIFRTVIKNGGRRTEKFAIFGKKAPKNIFFKKNTTYKNNMKK